MSFVIAMNRCTGPRTPAEAYGVTLQPGHECTHACKLTHQPPVYHPQCMERHGCMLAISESAEVTPAQWAAISPRA